MDGIETSSAASHEEVVGPTATPRSAHKRGRSISIENEASEAVSGSSKTKRLAVDMADSFTHSSAEPQQLPRRQEIFSSNKSPHPVTASSSLSVSQTRQESTPVSSTAANRSVSATSISPSVAHPDMLPAQGPVLGTPQANSQGYGERIINSSGVRKGGRVVYLWQCCYCGHAGMNASTVPACNSCGVARCGNCHTESHRVRQ